MNDYISRQAAIDAIRTKYCPSDFMDEGVIDAFAEIIQDLPSTQPEILASGQGELVQDGSRLVQDCIVDAMKKQIPQKPIEKPEKYNKNLWHLYCPSCENWIGIWNNRLKRGDMYNNSNSHICPYCGQAIDWEEAES